MTKDYPFSMRLRASDKIWLDEQAKLLDIPVTHVIRKLFDFNRMEGVPTKNFTLVGDNLTGDVWTGACTGLIRVQIVGANTPVRSVEIHIQEKTLDEFKQLLLSMLTE